MVEARIKIWGVNDKTSTHTAATPKLQHTWTQHLHIPYKQQPETYKYAMKIKPETIYIENNNPYETTNSNSP